MYVSPLTFQQHFHRKPWMVACVCHMLYEFKIPSPNPKNSERVLIQVSYFGLNLAS